MRWFIKKYVFNHVLMKKVQCDVLNLDIRLEELSELSKTKNVQCSLVDGITPKWEEKLRDAFQRMDIKQQFDIIEAKRRLSKKYIFVVAEVDDRVIGWSWGAVGKVYFKEFFSTIVLEEGSAFSYNTYVGQAFRGVGVGMLILKYILFWIREKGYQNMWGLIYPWNKGSLKMLENAGFKITGDYRFIRILGMDLHLAGRKEA